MKKLFWRTLFFLVPFLYSIYLCSQPAAKNGCGATCFSTQLVSVEEISSTCKTYELKVSYSKDCAHALSHYSVALPCGKITSVSNSENWAQEIGTDPTTGISGFKIDDIKNFGETPTTSFTVNFTVCNDDADCATQLKCWQPVVAYKASTCVNYETVTVPCKSLKASLQQQNASCFGSADGSLAVVIEEGTEPFTFLWSDNSTEQAVQGVSAGEYSVVVKDASGAELTLSATVAQPDEMIIEGVTSAASCNGKSDGAIDITVSGGNAPYSFTWNNGNDSEDLSALAAGQYTVQVKDKNNCAATARFTISNTSTLSLAVALSAPECNGTNGAIDLSVSGGQAPYSFQWSNGATAEDMSDISAGLYSVLVTDNAGCSASRSIFLKENNTLIVKGLSTPASCSGEATGGIDLTVSGGTAPYTYTWSNGSSSEDLSGVESGFYSVTVQDDKGCSVTANYTVTTKTFQLPRTVVQPTCDGKANGSITLLEPIGGTAPYTYEWSNGQTGNTLTDLGPGSYTVTVTDAAGCSKTLTLSITAPAPIIASATVSSEECNAEGSYQIDLNVSGGTEPYHYEWSNGASTEDLQGLSGGVYSVIITDAKGCSLSKDVVVEVGSPLSCLIDEPIASPVCGSTNNVLSTSVSDADSYSWSVQSSDDSWTLILSNAPSATYTAGSENSTATFTLTIIKDGCTKTCSYTINACSPDQTPEQPGGEEPGGEDPGEETPGNNGQPCEECLSSTATLIASVDGCRTYEIEVSTNGLCAHDLSHWTIAIPCGNISSYSNSRGWKMEIGQDPTTGLYGLKVDDISSFGKESASFTVRFTLCGSSCDLTRWDPVVGYKSGQCVATGEVAVERADVVPTSIAAYPNPFTDIIYFEWQAASARVSLDIIDQYGNIVVQSTSADTTAEGFSIDLHVASLPKGMYYYRLTVDGKVHKGKISKR